MSEQLLQTLTTLILTRKLTKIRENGVLTSQVLVLHKINAITWRHTVKITHFSNWWNEQNMKIKKKKEKTEEPRSLFCHNLKIKKDFLTKSRTKNAIKDVCICLDFRQSAVPHSSPTFRSVTNTRFWLAPPDIINLLHFDLPLWHIFGFPPISIDFS